MSPTFMFNVERNPKIPFLAKGIIMATLPEYGRSMIADRDFKAGDVILEEKQLACSVNTTTKYEICHYCSSSLKALLTPCLGCASVIYCSAECRNADLKSNHRFECGICEKLDHISYGASRIGLKMFFHGLSLFDDDVDRMMTFCNAYDKTDTDPLTLDYSNYDSLEEFKVFHQTKVPDINLKNDTIRFHAALYYSIVIEHPPVRALLKNEAQMNFMLQCIYDFMRTSMFLARYQVNFETFQLYSIASVCNHSCIPNTYAVSHDGKLKFVVLRPIKKGEQILTSYDIMYAAGDIGYTLPTEKNFICICVNCYETKKQVRRDSSRGELTIPLDFLFGAKAIRSTLNAMNTFMNKYGHLHPHQDFDQYIRKYRQWLTTDFLADSANKQRISQHVQQCECDYYTG